MKSSSTADGSWEVAWEGTYQYVGRSGKYNDIKGSGKYKGKASAQDPLDVRRVEKRLSTELFRSGLIKRVNTDAQALGFGPLLGRRSRASR